MVIPPRKQAKVHTPPGDAPPAAETDPQGQKHEEADAVASEQALFAAWKAGQSSSSAMGQSSSSEKGSSSGTHIGQGAGKVGTPTDW